MTVKTAKRPKWYGGPAFEDAASPTGWSSEQYDLNDPKDYEAWEAAWKAAYPNGVAGDPTDGGSSTAPAPRVQGEHADAYEGDPIKKAREAEALAWVVTYTERVRSGDILRPFGLIMDIGADRRFGSKYMHLSERQVEVILNSKERQLQWDAERAEAEKRRNEQLRAAPVVPLLPEGRRYYAVESERQLTFLRITRTKQGMTFVDQIVGGGAGMDSNPQPRGRVLTNGQYLGTFENLYRAVVADPEAAMVRFGHEIGRCGYCGRTLTDEESRAAGIGPVCRTRGFGGEA